VEALYEQSFDGNLFDGRVRWLVDMDGVGSGWRAGIYLKYLKALLFPCFILPRVFLSCRYTACAIDS
jgi:hypothetical protein